jgi:hypothetical protein
MTLPYYSALNYKRSAAKGDTNEFFQNNEIVFLHNGAKNTEIFGYVINIIFGVIRKIHTSGS